jgi:hypothetical protein
MADNRSQQVGANATPLMIRRDSHASQHHHSIFTADPDNSNQTFAILRKDDEVIWADRAYIAHRFVEAARSVEV